MIALFPITLTVLAWLLALLWFWKAVTCAYGLRHIPNLADPKYGHTRSNGQSINVIVPACNEAEKIEACLKSLLDQHHPHLKIIAVDDRSIDSTGTIMDALALQNPDRLSVIHITELPIGWLGKTHAMAIAANHAISAHYPDYLLFTDADILFHPDAIRLTLAHTVATQADHFVILPTTLVKTAGEGMLLAYLQVMSFWAVRPWKVSDPKARDAVGVGAFNLVRTSVYQQIGRFESVRMEVVEDLTFGRRIKRAGFRQRIATGPGLVSVHWASGLAGILNGLTKNFFAIFHFRIILLLLACAWIALFCIVPAVLIFLPQTHVPAILILTSVSFLYFLSSRQSMISPWYALLLPISATLIVYSILRSMVTTLKQGGIIWRGTFYSLSDLRKDTAPLS
jgi:glycosyltransferase involved in cell wall biosynthesis